ncbi:hypothetical protein SAMN04490206_2915 [Pseudomonas umsongensis]|jgi:hypothetical protein|nr:hypothetical protein SAMN04490206_2915 [Pseudomonas umsongensis]
MLAMEVNDDAGSLTPRSALRFFASMLAPTGTGLTLSQNSKQCTATPGCTVDER